MLTELRRAVRALRDPTIGRVALAWFLDRTGDWIVLLALLTVAADGSRDNASPVAWTLVLWIAPRIVLGILYRQAGAQLGRLGWPALALVKAVLTTILVAGATAGLIRSFEILLGLTAVVGFVSAIAADTRYVALTRRVGLESLSRASAAVSLVDRAAVLAGGAVAVLMALTLSGTVSPIPAIGAFAAAAALAFAVVRTLPAGKSVAPREAAVDVSRELARRTVIWLAAAFTGGAVGAAMLIGAFMLLSDVVGFGTSGTILVAATGLGLLLGPLPIPRFLLRASAELILIVLAVVVAVAAVAITAFRPPVVPQLVSPLALAEIAAAFVVFGFVAGSIDRLRSIALHRLVPLDQAPRIHRLSLLAVTAGQLFGAFAVISTAGRDAMAIAAVLAIAQVLLLLLGLARAGRDALKVGSLSPLPIKSVVHNLSWDTRPEAQRADPATSADNPRARRLARWINRQAQLQKLKVTLPVSGREYEIYRPDDDSRELLFDQGRADPDKQMPYWAKVWPSGVALADVVVERKKEVADARVLELGAGLGVTACAVLEYGGHIVTADYSDLPLAHCRLNTLVNTERAPRATCFNWRHASEVAAAAAQPEFENGFPLIIAGDVLYEGRDAEPLLNVIEQMLVANGSLWLAEPVRRTAQRFLDSAASIGWEIESRQVKAQWPDATEGPVNLHFLKRSPEPDRMAADLGGIRI